MSCVRGSSISDWHAKFGCHTDMLGTEWNVCARSCRSCKWSCAHITNRWSTLELRARHQIKLNLLCWACSLSPSSSAGQGQQQSGKKAVTALWRGTALGAHGVRSGSRRGRTRGDKKAAGAISDSRNGTLAWREQAWTVQKVKAITTVGVENMGVGQEFSSPQFYYISL